MARRKARVPQGKKLQPAPLTITTLFQTGPGRSVHYASLSQMASLVNRRFYRAGLNWAVAGIKIIAASAATGEVSVCKIPSTWIASNSWHKGYSSWQKMNQDALDETESVKARFTDFKVYMDAEHHQLGSVANLLPYSGEGAGAGSQLFNPGEWDYSKVVVPFGPASPGNTTDFDIVWTGGNFPGISPVTGANAVSLIEGYAASRGLPDIRDPNAPADAVDADGSTPENWLAALQNEGIDQDSEVLTDLTTENNQAPYPFENAQVPGAAPGTVFTDTMYPGGANQGTGVEFHDIALFTSTTLSETQYIKGGMFPGGLVKFDCTNFPDNTGLIVQFDLVPGHHRGYHCQKMQDM